MQLALQTVGQDNQLWKDARKYRITSSRCYQLYTYLQNKNPNWNQKIEKYFNQEFFGNENTRYGKFNEQAAKDVYEKQFGKIYNSGVLINVNYPWLACSPDGLKFFDGCFYRLIEIKCPVIGKTKSINECINTLPYIKCDNSKQFPYYINKKHSYYAQVQLSLALLDLAFCDFVIYSSHSNDILVIEVERDECFIQSLVKRLHFVYFNYCLTKLAS